MLAFEYAVCHSLKEREENHTANCGGGSFLWIAEEMLLTWEIENIHDKLNGLDKKFSRETMHLGSSGCIE